MASIWKNTAQKEEFPPLQGDVRTDVLIIGGGMAGLLTAYRLKQAGAGCLLVEADTVGGGITGSTTAKITSQHGLIYSRIARRYGLEAAGLYLRANEKAMAEYRRLCAGMDCGFQNRDAYVYSLEDGWKLEREMETLSALGFPAELCRGLPLPFPTAGAVKFPGQAQFHPLKFLYALAEDLPIAEHTRVRELRGSTAVTDHGTIRAEKIVIATHFPFLNKHGMYFLKLYQDRSYCLALENAPSFPGMYLDESGKGLSFRSHQGLLLLGGGGHRTGGKSGGWTVWRLSPGGNSRTAGSAAAGRRRTA